MDTADIETCATRRALFARIAARAGDRDIRRAERLLLRGLARHWPDTRIERLLRELLSKASLQATSGDAA